MTEYRVTNYRVTDYRSPRAILRLIALEGLVASLLGRIFADQMAPNPLASDGSSDRLQGDRLQGDRLQGDHLQGDRLQGDSLQELSRKRLSGRQRR